MLLVAPRAVRAKTAKSNDKKLQQQRFGKELAQRALKLFVADERVDAAAKIGLILLCERQARVSRGIEQMVFRVVGDMKAVEGKMDLVDLSPGGMSLRW